MKPYNAEKDFRMVMHQVSALNILAVSPSLPIHSVQDLVAHARANPGKLSYGISGFGASNHLALELMTIMTGARFTPVSYKSIQQAISDAIAGQIHVVCDNMGSISIPVGGTPEQLSEHLRKETAKWAQVIKSAGIKPQ